MRQKSGISFWGMWSLRYLLVIKWCWKVAEYSCSKMFSSSLPRKDQLQRPGNDMQGPCPGLFSLTVRPHTHCFQLYETLCGFPCSFICHVPPPAWNTLLSLIHLIPHPDSAWVLGSFGKPSLTPQARRVPLPLISNRAYPTSVIIALTTLYSN